MAEIHCMIDLETLGNSHDAAIIQIGACVFDKKEILESCGLDIDFKSACFAGSVTGDTIQWWMQQDDAAIKSVSKPDGRMTIQSALYSFEEWCKQYEIEHFWAHATFDFPILQNAYRAWDMTTPIHYRKCRDLRTAEFLLPDIERPEREGIYHDATSDAEYQAKCLQMMWAAA